MQNISELLALKLSLAFKECYNEEVPVENIKFQKTNAGFKGDLTFVVFPFLKISKASPEITAATLGEYLMMHSEDVVAVEIVKGFLNITVSDIYYINSLNLGFNNSLYGSVVYDGSAPIVLEYSSPNTNKPLHLGHVRNNLLGRSLAYILEAAGKKVIKVNLVNDRGIHICKSMLGYMKWGRGETPESAGLKGDKLVGKFYVLFEQNYKSEIQELVNKGLKEEDATKSAPLILEAQNILRLWEAGNAEIISLWKVMNKWVLEGFDVTYNRLGIDFDKTYYESDIYLSGKSIVENGLADGNVTRDETGAVWADLTNEGLDRKILIRSDGTSVYITQDIGTAALRHKEFEPDKMIYVVGNEQIYHFDVLKKILLKLGYCWADKLFHLSYGMVELPEGKMKTREGTVVDADDIMDEMYDSAKQITSELGKTENLSSEEADKLFNIIGLGALKYFILKVDPKKNMLFNPAESIDFDGNTGPFVQYTYARICSLSAKAELAEVRAEVNPAGINVQPIEKALLILLHDFPDVVKQAAGELSPSVIVNYVYELSRTFNQFYHEIPVLKENDATLKSYRLALVKFTGITVKNAMGLLGISVPERM